MRSIRLIPALLLVLAAPSLSAQVARRPFLFKDARGELAQARARGESDVLMAIASMPGQNARVASLIAELGGTVQFRRDNVDYVRARVPLEQVERLVAHPAVHSADLSIVERPRVFGLADRGDETPSRPLLSMPAAAPPDTDTVRENWPPTLSAYPLTNRYSPLGDIRALDFLEDNPTFDGRGVTIAMIDMNPDALAPELQVAKTLDGETVPKISIYQTALDPEEEDDGRWLRMTDMVDVEGETFPYHDTTYTAPRPGTFRIAMFDEARADSLGSTGLDKDYNRDGNPEGSSRLFAVLWDESTNDVWVDTDQDLNFTDENTLGDYSVKPEFGVFGTDDPDTPHRESIAFGVQIDDEKKLVALNPGVAWHASLVVGAALASRGTDGRFDGVAPGARLASVSEGGSTYGQTEAVILALENPDVDLAYLEQSSNVTHNYLLRDGRLVPTVIYARLIERYQKPLVVPTHNFPILGGIDDLVLARGAIGIGGHESKENFFVNHGVRVEHDDNLLITGGYGPMGDGALKPDVISPSNHLSTAQGFEDDENYASMAGLYQMPPGYAIAGGTSTATPTAAGAVALLISAARQAGVRHDAYSIKHAVTRGARWVPHLPAYKQGNGVISVASAWEILQELNAGSEPITITSRAPVKHPYSHLLPTPNEGVGLYEREGWSVGDRGARTVTFTRTSGPGESMTFSLTWAGNDGTFSSPTSVVLPLNQPTPVTIGIAPDTAGVHTAHLTLSHPSVPGHAYRMLAAIASPDRLSASNDFTVESRGRVPRPGMQSFFYEVPQEMSALRIQVRAPERPVALAVMRPDGRGVRGARTSGSAGTETVVIDHPVAGMWEVRLSDIADTRTFDWKQAQKAEPVPPTPATLTVSALAAEVDVIGADGAGMTADTGRGTTTHDVWITNRGAAFTGGATNTPVGSARRERPVIAAREQHMFEVEVLPGATTLLAGVRNVSDLDADLDVYVFDCTGEECRGVRADGDPVGEEWVMVRDPDPGKWKVVVDAAEVPSGNTGYEYLDVVLHPAYGTVSTTDLPQERAKDARWTAKAHAWVAPAAHEEGRAPFVALLIRGEDAGGDPYFVSLVELAQPRASQAWMTTSSR